MGNSKSSDNPDNSPEDAEVAEVELSTQLSTQDTPGPAGGGKVEIQVPLKEPEGCCACCVCCDACKDIDYEPALAYDEKVFNQNVKWRVARGFGLKDGAMIFFSLVFVVFNVYSIIRAWIERPDWDVETPEWDPDSPHTSVEWKLTSSGIVWFELGMLIVILAWVIFKYALIPGTMWCVKRIYTGCCSTSDENTTDNVNCCCCSCACKGHSPYPSARQLALATKHFGGISSFYLIRLFHPMTAWTLCTWTLGKIWSGKWCFLFNNMAMQIIGTVAFLLFYVVLAIVGLAAVSYKMRTLDFMATKEPHEWDFWEVFDILNFLRQLGVLGSSHLVPGYGPNWYLWKALAKTDFCTAFWWGLILEGEEFLIMPWADL